MTDVLIDRPLAEILNELNLAKEVKGALLGEENAYRALYELVVRYESDDWDIFYQTASKLNVNHETIPECYIKAVMWAEEAVRAGAIRRTSALLAYAVGHVARSGTLLPTSVPVHTLSRIEDDQWTRQRGLAVEVASGFALP